MKCPNRTCQVLTELHCCYISPSFASKNNASSTETDAGRLTTYFASSTLFIFFKTKNNNCQKKQNFILKCTSMVWGENAVVGTENQTQGPWLELPVLWPLSDNHWVTTDPHNPQYVSVCSVFVSQTTLTYGLGQDAFKELWFVCVRQLKEENT